MTDALKGFLSGGAGGMSLVFVGHPLDTMKVRLQTAPKGTYSGMIDCFSQTIKADGIRGLYKGMTAPLIGITPIFAVYFMGFDLGKSIAAKAEGVEREKISTAGIMFAGGFSALPGTILMVPGERIKVLLQTDGQGGTAKRFNGTMDCAKKIVAEEGLVAGMYKGWEMTLLRDIPGSIAYYGAYELMKRAMEPADGSGKLSVATTLTAGGLAGCANWIVAVPPDVIKSRFQTAAEGTGVRQILAELLKEEGITGLYKGLGPAMIRAFPANAACFLGMEVSRKWLDKIL
jgi:solute carrier family 25 carnitine/acylcarnitine transporter 20/29